MTISNIAHALIILFPILVALAIGGIIADYILPHIKPLQRYFDSLSDWDE